MSRELPNLEPKFQSNFTKFAILFDMLEDPSERNDVSDSHPEIVELLLTKLADYFVSIFSGNDIIVLNDEKPHLF